MRSIGRITALAVLLSCALQGRAQHPLPCGTDLHRARNIAADPAIGDWEALQEAFIQQWISEHAATRDADTLVYVIPTVFHVVHMDGEECISNAQIADAMEVLNRDFRKLNADVAEVCCGFQDIAADVRVEFRLATVDPLGFCTNGIDRIRSVETFVGDNGSKLAVWPRDKYLNIWTMAKMEGGVAGYSQYPSSVDGNLAPADGVIILHDYIGRTGTGTEGRSRALTHEIGHWLDLKHVWGDNNGVDGAPQGHMSPVCGDDAVEDTPLTRGWSTCPTPAQSTDCDDAVAENFENYMEYSYCSKMFTEGQSLRMRAALASTMAERNMLYTPENLAATGVAHGHEQLCAPVADFRVFNDGVPGAANERTPQGTRMYCIGDNVNFYDNSTRASVDSWQWTFQDGVPATSTERDPVVSFTSGGWKSVTLTVGNAQGSSTRTDAFAVFIADEWSFIPGPVQEDFEGNDCPECPYIVENYEGNTSQWQATSDAARSGSRSMRLNAFDSFGINDYFIDEGDNDIDAFATPTMDLRWLQNGQLTFWWAYATRGSSPNDVTERLEIWSSSTCGRTWNLRETISGTELITDGADNSFYVPATPGAWRQFQWDLPTSLSANNVRFKFVYYSGIASNNLYIDDINITGTVGIDQRTTVDPGLLLVPNPAADELSIVASLPDGERGELVLLDASGRICWSHTTARVAQERVVLDVRSAGIAPGLYMVQLQHPRGVRTERLVVR